MKRSYLVINEEDMNKTSDLLESNNIEYYGASDINYIVAFEKAQDMIDVDILKALPNDTGSEYNKRCLEAEDLKDEILSNINSQLNDSYFEDIFNDWNNNKRGQFWRDRYCK